MSPVLPASPARTLEQTRERNILWTTSAVALAGGVCCAALMWLLLVLAPQAGATFVGIIAGRIPGVEKGFTFIGVKATDPGPALVIAFLGGAGLAWGMQSLVRWAADHLFPSFDSDLLRPIRWPRALDPLWLPPRSKDGSGLADEGMRPLPWVAPPPDSPRGAVWDGLVGFVSSDVGDGRFGLLGHPRTEVARFRWTVLTGRPGSGKTRLATEIARARARRKVLGDGERSAWVGEVDDASLRHRMLGDDGRKARVERRRLARNAWLRLTWPFARRREAIVPGVPGADPFHGADPWDAGWVVAARDQGDIGRGQNTDFDEGVLDRLRAWRPRRPTVLVLDDPRPGNAGRVVGALLKGERHYRHPVRLIVVNQTLPEELKLELRSDGSWQSKVAGFFGPMFALDAAAPLSIGEVRLMFGKLQLSGHVSGWKPNDDNVGRLLLRARGNAFLVCLALQQIQRQRYDETIPADWLLCDRAQRIVEALEAAGVGTPDQLRAIAWATLVSGSESLAISLPEEASEDWPCFEPTALALVPNLDLAWPAPAPPVVRPEPVGDAFVRLVLSNRRCDAKTRKHVIWVAWRRNPSAMLAAVRRLGAGDDEVAAILRQGPPDEAGLNPVDVTLAYVAAAIRVPRPEWDAGELPRQSPAVRSALSHIHALPPDRAVAAFTRVVELLDVSNALWVVRGRAARMCIYAAIRRGLQDDLSWQDPAAAEAALATLVRTVSLLRRWGADPRRDERSHLVQSLGRLVARAMPVLADPAAMRLADSLVRTVWQTSSAAFGTTAAVLSAFGHTLAERGGSVPLIAACAHRIAATAAIMRSDEDAVQRAADAADVLAQPLAENHEIEFERVRVGRCIAYARMADAAACERAARHVDSLARPFAGERRFEFERVRAWRSVAYALLGDVAACERAARHIDELTRPFAGEREFECERVRAWSCVANSLQGDAAACESTARNIDWLVRSFAGEREFEWERVRAWSCVANSLQSDYAACERAARHVDELARPFAGERGFEFERALAWRCVAYACEGNAAALEDALRHLDWLVRPFAGDRDFEFERAQAWRCAANARTADAAACERAARHVDSLARPFAGDQKFALERVRAWSCVAYAGKANAAACERAARLVDGLAHSFAGDREFELGRVQAWCCVTYARTSDVAACERAARHVDELARPFAGEREFELERAQAWRCVAYAHRADAAAWKDAVRKVEELARPFLGDPRFEVQCTEAQSYRQNDPDLPSLNIQLAISVRLTRL